MGVETILRGPSHTATPAMTDNSQLRFNLPSVSRGHYGREEAMTWCENNGVDYIFGLAGNVVLDQLVEPAADDIRVRRAVNQAEVLRGFAETRYAAKSWDKERRVVARMQIRLQ